MLFKSVGFVILVFVAASWIVHATNERAYRKERTHFGSGSVSEQRAFLTTLREVDSRDLFPIKHKNISGLVFPGQNYAQSHGLKIRGKLELLCVYELAFVFACNFQAALV